MMPVILSVVKPLIINTLHICDNTSCHLDDNVMG